MSTVRPTLQLDRLLHGGDYNPDQWPEAVWDEDVALMGTAGWNIATLPVFGWAAVNPAEGVYTFDWLDRAIDALHRGGVGVCLATATGATPAWLDQQYPAVRMTDENGVHRMHGGRHMYCPTSPDYRRLAGDLARQLARRYGHHPALKLWHVSNEMGGTWPTNYCYCQLCTEAFRDWLRQRYGTIEALNAAWSLAFWGHQYSGWSQVDPPFTIGERGVQAQVLDWRRFHTIQLRACYENEAAAVRAITPTIPVTTNLMGGPFFPVDYHVFAEALDVISWDSYPRHDTPWAHTAFTHSVMRGLKGGAPFLLMEQTPSQANYAPSHPLKAPGLLRRQSLQALSQGAESVMYFQWRRSYGGLEKFHGAVLEHHGRSDARVFREVAAIGADLARLGTATLGGRTRARACILFDWESWWALSSTSGLCPGLQVQKEAAVHFQALHESGIACDVVDVGTDLSGYDLIIAPGLYLLQEAHAAAITDRVAAGATLVTGFCSAMVDGCDRIHPGGAPGPLAQVLGLRVEEWDGLPPEVRNGVRFHQPVGDAIAVGQEAVATLHCTRFWLAGAEAVATYTGGFYAGDPAIARHAHGTGQGWYLGTRIEDAALAGLLRGIARDLGLGSALAGGVAPAKGLEVATRIAPDGTTVLYLINHGPEPVSAPLTPGPWRDLLAGGTRSGEITLGGGDAAILAVRSPSEIL